MACFARSDFWNGDAAEVLKLVYKGASCFVVLNRYEDAPPVLAGLGQEARKELPIAVTVHAMQAYRKALLKLN